MSLLTLFDLEEAINGFFEHCQSFEPSRKLACECLVKDHLWPLFKWLKELPETLVLKLYMSGGYSCIGFELGGVFVRGIPMWGGVLLNRGKHLRDLLVAATGSPKDAPLSSLARSCVKDVHLAIEVLRAITSCMSYGGLKPVGCARFLSCRSSVILFRDVFEPVTISHV